MNYFYNSSGKNPIIVQHCVKWMPNAFGVINLMVFSSADHSRGVAMPFSTSVMNRDEGRAVLDGLDSVLRGNIE